MTKVNVYKFKVWDFHRECYIDSPFYATLEAIAKSQATLVENSHLTIDASLLDERGRYRTPGPVPSGIAAGYLGERVASKPQYR
jgi:hypothetical protein